MDLNRQPVPLDFAGIPAIDGSLSSVAGADGQVDVSVVEHLRVRVPAAARAAWLEAEQGSWEPWLNRQSGFIGRQLHWDSQREEGQLLIHWASREQWLAVPRQELEEVQERFERLAHAALVRLGATAPLGDLEGAAANPFPLVYEGELPPRPRGALAQDGSGSEPTTPEAIGCAAGEAVRSAPPKPASQGATGHESGHRASASQDPAAMEVSASAALRAMSAEATPGQARSAGSTPLASRTAASTPAQPEGFEN